MNISISSSSITAEVSSLNGSKKLLIAGPSLSSFKAREIVMPADKDEAFNLFGQSPLYEAYELLKDLGISNIYLSNCYNRSDYLRLMDKIIHYDFDYFIPINLYFRDTFYNPTIDEEQYYSEYFLEQFAQVNSLTTVLMTEKHASLYEDFDHYAIEMANVELTFLDKFNYDKSNLLEDHGNNLNFVYNNLQDIPYANVVLGGLYANRDYAKYLSSIKNVTAIYDLDYNDMQGLRAMYFKNNFYTADVTLENPLNFKKTLDIYANALIDDVIKKAIKSIDLEKFKGRLYNQYVAVQVESEATKALNSLKTKLFKEYTINRVGFKKTDPTSGYIILDYSFVPYGTLESINVIMGV